MSNAETTGRSADDDRLPVFDQPAALAAAIAGISQTLRSCDLSTPVPHLGRWKIRDVAAHLGGVHRWATRIVHTRSMDGPGFTKSKLDGIELCDWFDEGAAELLDAFANNDLEDPCPNFNPGSDKSVRWWIRRQIHETTVHRWDVERPQGTATPIRSVIAADGIDEFVDVFIRTRGKQTLTGPLVLETTEPPCQWTLRPAERPGRIDVSTHRSPDVETEIAGEPEELLLMLWGRIALTDTGLSIGGDHDVAASLIAG